LYYLNYLSKLHIPEIKWKPHIINTDLDGWGNECLFDIKGVESTIIKPRGTCLD
jgi:hypothetical protein